MQKEQQVANATLWQARGWVILAAVLWSTSGFFAKTTSLAEMTPGGTTVWRSLFAGLCILPLVRQVRWSWRLLPMMLCFAAMCYTYICSLGLMSHASAGNALWLQCTATMWVFLIGVLVFGEAANRRDWWMVLFSVSGVAIIICFRSQGTPLLAIGLGLLSGMLYAAVVLWLRSLREFDPAWLAVLNQFGTVCALAPIAFWEQSIPSGTNQWLMLMGFGFLQLGLPYVFFGRALRSLPGHEASVIALLEPLLLPVWIYLAAGYVPDAVTLLGGSLILIGLVVRYVPLKTT